MWQSAIQHNLLLNILLSRSKGKHMSNIKLSETTTCQLREEMKLLKIMSVTV